MISEVGILQDSSFFYELNRRLSAKILPFQPEKDTLQYILNQVFYLQTDYQWIERIDRKEVGREIQQQRHEHSAKEVNVLERIERKPPHHGGRLVAKVARRIAMCRLMHCNGEQHGQRASGNNLY